MTKKGKEEARICEFCGAPISEGKTKIRKFCSLTCRQRSTRNKATLGLAVPLSKCFRKRLMFSNPLYFN
jgi:RNA polymerase-binding transcription factor DksA